MRRKGFTLVELLAVIIIIAIIAVIVFPIVTRQIKSSKEKALAVQLSEIIRAAKDWAIDNPDSLDQYHINPTYVSITDLQREKKTNGDAYLSSGKIKNPKTGEEMKGTVVITYDEEHSQYEYEYKEIDKSELMKSNVTGAAITLLKNVTPVTSSKTVGLYDDGVQNKYIYRGANPNNYINIGGQLWRILSIDKETYRMKVIKHSHTTKNSWSGTTTPSSYIYGNNGLSIYTYLNTNFYESLVNIKGKMSLNSQWYNGEVSNVAQSISSAQALSKGANVNANVGLLSVAEYLDAAIDESSDQSCRNNFKSQTCKTNNYLAFSTGYWLINTVTGSNNIWTASSNGLSVTSPTSTSMIAMPVITLSASASLKEPSSSENLGSSSNPFILDV